MNKKARVIAFYLPQFHPIPENDNFWGKGFTEWTNVGKAKPLFKGHNQPRVPTELGYYDLRLPIVREQQAELAREAGVTAFCYWHYWFGNGKRLIADIFDDVLESGKPDFPFCLGWANHSWYAKNWNSDGSTTNKLLIEQTYPGIEDEKMHFEFLLRAFKDPRYVKIGGAPFLYIFDPLAIPDEYLNNFRQWAKQAGFQDLFLVANIVHPNIKKEDLLNRGFNAVTYQKLGFSFDKNRTIRGINKLKKRIYNFIFHLPPNAVDYREYSLNLIDDLDKSEDVIPCIIPQWDHTPRSGWNGSLFINATPEVFYKHVIDALNAIKDKPSERQILMLKSWNEWGEGNYMEPDLKFGRGFIDALRKAVEDFNR